jgi:hypothetical protein
MSKLRTRLALTVVGAALLLSALVLLDQHEAAASDTLPSRGPAAVPGAPPVHNPSNRAWVDPLNSPQEQSAKPIATVQSLASTEPQVPVGARLEAPATSGIAPVSDVRPAEATAATAAPPTPARRDPATTEVAAYIARARAKIQQGDIAAARRLLERASDSDAAEAWFALAETYEPQVLARWGVLGVKPDLEKARTLYQRAETRGAQGARERLLAIRQ